MDKPLPQSYWVHPGLLCAGHYPGDTDPAERDSKLRRLLGCGIRRVLNLMESSETGLGGRPFEPYAPRLQELAAERNVDVECLRLPIPDASAPTREAMRAILDTIDGLVQQELPTYVHCWGGHGRTSTVIACYLIRRGSSPRGAIGKVRQWRAGLPKHYYPFEGGQERFVLSWRCGQ